MTSPIGFVGVGSMGSAIAGRLIGRYELLFNDRNPRAGTELAAAGARFTTTSEIARSCDIVFLSLPGPDDVLELLTGEGGMAAELRAGAIVIDTTTGSPTADAIASDALRAVGADLLDSPIGGGVRRAREGSATLMVGGAADAFERAAAALRTITPDVFHVGPSGAGHAMKLVNNLLNSCNRFAALEAVRLGQACGIDQDTVVAILNKSTGRNYATEYTFPTLLSGDEYKLQGFTLSLMEKDIRLANDLARSLDHATPIGTLVEDMTREGIERFGPGADQSQLMAEWYPPSR